MDELREWLKKDSEKHVLWIRGPPGVGKSVIAAYLIDFISRLESKAIVAYFFCKTSEGNLASAREIIRTLAYQCLSQSPCATSFLATLKQRLFDLRGKWGVRFLFRKLLEEPLRHVNEDIYIVLDGLDDSNMMTRDEVERRTEGEVLVDCLRNLTSLRRTTWVLLISRPNFDVRKVDSSCLVKTIDAKDNEQDIKTHVMNAVARSETLKAHFVAERIDPLRYFCRNSNGIFLWVGVVLHELAQINSHNHFLRCLETFADTCGDMDKVYSKILFDAAKVHTEADLKWIHEILDWLNIAEEPLYSNELRAAVEWSQKDQLGDFQRFLTVQCGSLVQCLPDGPGFKVKLVHETLRSFLDPEKRPNSPYTVNWHESHAKASLFCLQSMINCDNSPNPFVRYSFKHWTKHLLKSNSTWHQLIQLGKLHAFFHSTAAITRWIKDELRNPYHPFKDKTENNVLNELNEWLIRVNSDPRLSEAEGSRESVLEEIPHAALVWRAQFLSKQTSLQVDVGKAATTAWLYNKIDTMYSFRHLFSLSVDGYWSQLKAENSTPGSVMDKLVASNFSCIAEWAGHEEKGFDDLNLCRAAYVLQRWQTCIVSCHNALSRNVENPKIWATLGNAYSHLGDHEPAIQAYTKALQIAPKCLKLWNRLGSALMSKGDFSTAIEAFEYGLSISRETSYCLPSLQRLYNAASNYERPILVYQNVIAKFTSEKPYDYYRRDMVLDMHNYLGRIYLALGRPEMAIELLTREIEKNGGNQMLLRCLGGVYLSMKRFSEANQVYESALRRAGGTRGKENALKSIACMHWVKGDYEKMLEAFERAEEEHATDFPWSASYQLHPSKAYKLIDDREGVVRSCMSTVERLEEVWLEDDIDIVMWDDLLPFYIELSGFDRAIKACEAKIQRTPSPRGVWYSLGATFRAKGCFEEAIKAFEIAVKFELPDIWQYDVEGMCLLHADTYKSIGRHKEAAMVYEPAIQLYIDYLKSDILEREHDCRLARLCCAQGNHQQALRVLEERTEVLPTDEEAWMQMSEVLRVKGEFDQMIELCQRGIVKNPSSVGLWQCLAFGHHAKGEYGQAIQALHSAIDVSLSSDRVFWDETDVLRSSERVFWDEIGDILRAQGDGKADAAYNQTIRICETKLKIPPEELYNTGEGARLWYMIGHAYEGKNELRNAITAFRKAIEIRPWRALLWCRLGQIYEHLGCYERAIQTYTDGISRCRKIYLLQKCLGDCYRRNNRTMSAIGSYEEAIKDAKDPKFIVSYIDSSFSQNRRCWNAAEKINSTLRDHFVWAGLCQCYEMIGKGNEAIKVVQLAEKQYMTTTESGCMNNLLWRPDRKAFMNPLEQYLPMAIVWAILGEVYWTRSEFRKAVYAFEKAIEENGSNNWLMERIHNAKKRTGGSL